MRGLRTFDALMVGGHPMSVSHLGFGVVSLAGPSTLYELPEIRETLLSALCEGKDLHIDLETSGPWDLAGLQLVMSAVASGRKMGLSVRLVNVPKICVDIAERSGLADWLHSVTDSFL